MFLFIIKHSTSDTQSDIFILNQPEFLRGAYPDHQLRQRPPGQKRQLRGVALVHADGYIDFIGELDQVQKPDRLVVEGEYLVGYDLNGNEIFRQLIRSTRRNALTHLPLLLGD